MVSGHRASFLVSLAAPCGGLCEANPLSQATQRSFTTLRPTVVQRVTAAAARQVPLLPHPYPAHLHPAGLITLGCVGSEAHRVEVVLCGQAHVRVDGGGQSPEQGDGGLGSALFEPRWS